MKNAQVANGLIGQVNNDKSLKGAYFTYCISSLSCSS